MDNQQITVIAHFQAKSGKEGRLEEELLKMIAPTRAEPGCLNYDLHRAAEPGRFVFYENWASQAHLDQHVQTPHFQLMKQATADLLGAPLEIALLKMISEPASK